VLAIGLVVDDAIVMLENILAHRGRAGSVLGRDQGRARIGFAVTMTLTLVAVARAGVHAGAPGACSWEFALALAGAVLVSSFVA
jgi:HAE1 family hydrophobic/amphiphilic exporter-1